MWCSKEGTTMAANSKQDLTYILVNGQEKTIQLNPEILSQFVKWFYDANGKNAYDLKDVSSEETTFYKDTIASVRY